MAWGLELFGGQAGKIILTVFRLAAVIFGTWYLGKIIKQGYSRGFIVCASEVEVGNNDLPSLWKKSISGVARTTRRRLVD